MCQCAQEQLESGGPPGCDGLQPPPLRRERKNTAATMRTIQRTATFPEYRYLLVVNRYTVVELNLWPGFNSVVGNDGLFGESGKCCVSRQNPDRRPYTFPPLPWSVPSRKFPV